MTALIKSREDHERFLRLREFYHKALDINTELEEKIEVLLSACKDAEMMIDNIGDCVAVRDTIRSAINKATAAGQDP